MAPTMRGQKLSRAIEPEMRAAQAAQQAGRWREVLDDAQAAEREQQKLGNIAEARRAFARLKDVPNVSPRIVRLWGLYADTLAGQAQTADSVPASRQLEQASLRPLQPDARK
jgi:hypothetical protein